MNCSIEKFPKKDYLNELLLLSNPVGVRAVFSYPGKYTNPIKKRNVLDEIVKIIRDTKSNLLIYAYSFNHPEILSEIKKAKDRGVLIKIVLDKDKSYEEFKTLEIPFSRWEGSGLHHLKILISDQKTLFLGTGNFSDPGLLNDWNGYLIFPLNHSEYLGLVEHLEERTNSTLEISGVEFYFSPENGLFIQDLILSYLESSRESIKYLAFDHYDEVVSHVLRKASYRGVQIEGVYNDPVDPEGIYLQNEMFGFFSDIYRDGNTDTITTESEFPEGGLLHHKTILIDEKILLTGSFNFSESARDKNREFFMVIRNPYLVLEFLNEFNRIKNSSTKIDKSKYNFEPIIEFSNDLYIQPSGELCSKNILKSGVLELGEGIWKTYLLYPDSITECTSLFTYDSISSGISNFKREKNFASDYLITSMNYYPRFSNSILSNGQNFSPFGRKEHEFLKISTIRFDSGGRPFWEWNENLKIPGKGYYWKPGKEWKEFLLDERDGIYSGNLSIPYNERDRGAIFIETENRIYMGCFYEKGVTPSDTLDYLSKKIQLIHLRSQPLSCTEI